MATVKWVRDARDVLAVFGALDDASIAPTIETFIPRASANIGWYGELNTYLFGVTAPRTADLGEALTRVAEADRRDERFTQPQKARLLYGLATAAQVDRMAPESTLPSLKTSDVRHAAVGALAAAGPTRFDRKDRLKNADKYYDEFIATKVPNAFNSRHDSLKLRDTMLTDGLIGAETAKAPLCATSIATVNGIECVVVDTVATSPDVSLVNLMKVVNPYNWADNYPQFFASMDEDVDVLRPDGWRRVLETVRLIEGLDITTPLKYLPVADSPSPVEARLEYDLDESRMDDGDGKVRVDRGYINMVVANQARDPNQGGVRVRTRKVVHIDGIRPFAQERLVCITGYGTASADFLFGKAAPPSETAKMFEYAVSKAQADAAQADDATTPSPVRHAVPTAVKMWTDTVQDVTADYVGLAEKWWDGALSIGDIQEFGRRVSGKLTSTPVEFMQAMTKPREPRS